MKKIFTIIALIASTYTFAQGPFNTGFDQFSNFGTYEEPVGWASLNIFSVLAPGFPVTAEKTTDVHSGLYALKLTTKAGNPDFTNYPQYANTFTKDTFPGMILLGDIGNEIEGTAYTERPSAVNFWYKYTSVDGDSAGFIFLLSKWDNVMHQRNTIGGAVVSMNATVNTYTNKNVPLQYADGTIPDTLSIIAFSSFDALYLLESNTPTHAAIPNSTLFLDDISILTTGVDESGVNRFDIKLYPNPAQGEISVLCTGFPQVNNPVSIEFYDMAGRKVHSLNITQMLTKADVSTLAAGMYIYTVKTGNSVVRTGKLTIAE